MEVSDVAVTSVRSCTIAVAAISASISGHRIGDVQRGGGDRGPLVDGQNPVGEHRTHVVVQPEPQRCSADRISTFFLRIPRSSSSIVTTLIARSPTSRSRFHAIGADDRFLRASLRISVSSRYLTDRVHEEVRYGARAGRTRSEWCRAHNRSPTTSGLAVSRSNASAVSRTCERRP